MPLRRALFLTLLAVSFSGTALAQTDGARELALGKEAYARRDYPAAAEHLGRAIKSLDARQERARLADAYCQLGMAQLVGLDTPREALTAFLGSTAFAEEPASAFLWAALAAERLGQTEASERYKALALQPPGANAQPEARAAAEPAPAAPAPVQTVAEEPEPAPEAKPDAFQYFFGKKKPESGEEKPPR